MTTTAGFMSKKQSHLIMYSVQCSQKNCMTSHMMVNCTVMPQYVCVCVCVCVCVPYNDCVRDFITVLQLIQCLT